MPNCFVLARSPEACKEVKKSDLIEFEKLIHRAIAIYLKPFPQLNADFSPNKFRNYDSSEYFQVAHKIYTNIVLKEFICFVTTLWQQSYFL
jgi:hypothetical protein